MLMRSRFVLKAESGVPALGWGEVVVLNSFSLLEVLKQMCLFVWKNKTHINAGRCMFFFLKREKTHTWKSENKTALGAAGGFYFSHILTEESDA